MIKIFLYMFVATITFMVNGTDKFENRPGRNTQRD
jgi:hypothetical protein